MGEHCTTDRPTPAGENPSGEMSKLGDVDVYIAKPNDYPHSPSKLLLLLSNGAGINSKNNQIQADKFAAEGFLVVMPDQFEGDPAPNAEAEVPSPADEPSVLEKVKLGMAGAAKSFVIDMWLARHTPEKVVPILRKVIDAAKEEFADAIANGGGIYAVGYCFGGKYVLTLASEQTEGDASEGETQTAKTPPLIKAGTMAHGTLVSRDDLNAVRAPVSLVCVEDDGLFPGDVLEAGRKFLADNKVEHEIEVYLAVPHGFAVVGDYHEANIMSAQGKAFEQMLGWLKSH